MWRHKENKNCQGLLRWWWRCGKFFASKRMEKRGFWSLKQSSILKVVRYAVTGLPSFPGSGETSTNIISPQLFTLKYFKPSGKLQENSEHEHTLHLNSYVCFVELFETYLQTSWLLIPTYFSLCLLRMQQSQLETLRSYNTTIYIQSSPAVPVISFHSFFSFSAQDPIKIMFALLPL